MSAVSAIGPRGQALQWMVLGVCLLVARAAVAEEWYDAYTKGLEALKQGQGLSLIHI